VARQFLESVFCAIITNIPLFFLWRQRRLEGGVVRIRAAAALAAAGASPMRAKIQQGLRIAALHARMLIR